MTWHARLTNSCRFAKVAHRHTKNRHFPSRARRFWLLKRSNGNFCGAAHSQLQDTGNETSHIPVLLEEILSYFSDSHLSSFIDGTLGAGGHSEAVIRQHPELKNYAGLDVDPLAHQLSSQRLNTLATELKISPKLSFYQKNYSQIEQVVSTGMQGQKADGILLDLGVSSMQMDSAHRGFSIMKDGPLDMRMRPTDYTNAETILNTWSEYDLGKIFREYGEERYWRSYALKVVDQREKEPIRTTQQLVKVIGGHSGKRRANGKKSIHPATRVFQALRIAVNDELEHLSRAIPECIDCLAPKGRLAVITFHSLEDRIVKHAFLKASGKTNSDTVYQPDFPIDVEGKILTRKPVVPSEEEQTLNPRSRSAKLRVFERA